MPIKVQIRSAHSVLLTRLSWLCIGEGVVIERKKQRGLPNYVLYTLTLTHPRPDICHEYHELYSWRKNCHVDKSHLSMYDNCGEIEKFSTCEEISVQLMGFYCNLCHFVAKSVIHAVLCKLGPVPPSGRQT